MSEMRQDRVTGRWVIIAPGRKERPFQVASSGEVKPTADFDPQCPFCLGHEDRLPGIAAEYACADGSGWCVRAVPNKFAALRPDVAEPAKRDGFEAKAAYGAQEVIIESQRHNAGLDELDDIEILNVVRAYRDRFTALMIRDGIVAVSLFRNEGPLSGASLIHPHAQLVATGFLSARQSAIQERAGSYLAKHGNCILCDDVAMEIADDTRMIEKRGGFACFVPYAAQSPFEIRIVPLRHQARFDEMNDNELQDFGLVLRGALRRLRAVHGALCYNFAVDSAGRGQAGSRHLHWQLRIVPDLVRWGGFELGTDIPINPSSPERDAEALRAAPQV